LDRLGYIGSQYIKIIYLNLHLFITATHTRFEHSIGTSHLAGVLIEHLKKSQPSLKITSADELCVKIAGLCHGNKKNQHEN
jgi:HD superfamily phosphohydrolase